MDHMDLLEGFWCFWLCSLPCFGSDSDISGRTEKLKTAVVLPPDISGDRRYRRRETKSWLLQCCNVEFDQNAACASMFFVWVYCCFRQYHISFYPGFDHHDFLPGLSDWDQKSLAMFGSVFFIPAVPDAICLRRLPSPCAATVDPLPWPRPVVSCYTYRWASQWTPWIPMASAWILPDPSSLNWCGILLTQTHSKSYQTTAASWCIWHVDTWLSQLRLLLPLLGLRWRSPKLFQPWHSWQQETLWVHRLRRPVARQQISTVSNGGPFQQWIEPMFQEVWICLNALFNSSSILKSCKGERCCKLNGAFDTFWYSFCTFFCHQSRAQISSLSTIQLNSGRGKTSRTYAERMQAHKGSFYDDYDVTLAVIIWIMDSQVCPSYIIINQVVDFLHVSPFAKISEEILRNLHSTLRAMTVVQRERSFRQLFSQQQRLRLEPWRDNRWDNWRTMENPQKPTGSWTSRDIKSCF